MLGFGSEMGLGIGHKDMKEVEKLLPGSVGSFMDDEPVDDQEEVAMLIVDFVNVYQQVVGPFHKGNHGSLHG